MKKGFLVFVVFLSVTTLGFAEALTLRSLEECLEQGIKHSTLLKQARLDSQSAGMGITEALTQWVPSVQLSAGYSRLSPLDPATITIPAPINQELELAPALDDSINFTVNLKAPLFTGFRIANSVDQAKAMVKLSGFALQQERQKLIFNITVAYWNLIKMKASKKVLEENLNLAQKHLKEITNFVNQGVATTNDLLKVKLNVAQVELQLLEADNAEQIAALTLLNSIGVDNQTKLEFTLPDENLSAPMETRGVQELLDQALQENPAMRIASSQRSAKAAVVKTIESGFFPSIFLTGNWTLAKPNPRVFPTKDQFDQTWALGVMAVVDPGSFPGTGAKAARARVEVKKADEALRQTRDSLKLQITQSYLELEKNVKQMELAGEMVSQATENHNTVAQLYKNGMALITDLLNAELLLLQSRLARTNSLIDYRIAQARLNLVLGRE